MSLLMLKTKNLSWQDHTLNIEVMLAPLRSTLLLNKHKTLDTKYDKEKALYERQRDACVKDYVVEKRLIERRRQKIINRKRELAVEARSKSAMEKEAEERLPKTEASANQGRSSSAPVDGRKKSDFPKVEEFHPTLPKLGLKHTPLFGGNLLRPRLFLETGPALSNAGASSESDTQSLQDYSVASKKKHSNASATSGNVFITGDGRLCTRSSSQLKLGTNLTSSRNKAGKSPKRVQLPPTITKTPASPTLKRKPPPAPVIPKDAPLDATGSSSRIDRGLTRRMPSVTFLDFLEQNRNEDDDEDDDDDDNLKSNVFVEVKQKSVEDKVRDFLRELDSFNSRPPTACSTTNDSVLSSTRSRESERAAKLVANRYHNLSMDKKLLEKAFDRYCERKTQEDLLKAMKLASKMKAHIRQARNTSLVPTMATFKSSRTFMKLLKRQQRRDRHAQEHKD